MTNWWNSLHTFQQALFVIACAATLFMIMQIILSAFGGGDNDVSFDADTDIDGVDSINDGGIGFTLFGLKILSVRTVIAFLAVGGWITFTLFYVINFWALLPGIAAGVAAAFAIALFFKALEKMQDSGNLAIENTVGKFAEVYLTVPQKNGGSGKVNVFCQERYVELEAVTDSPDPIKTGERVKVVSTLGEGTVVVERLYAAEAPHKENTEQGE